MKRPSIKARVAAGAALLDNSRPGWAAEIDIEKLVMASCKRCVLGQLYGDYSHAGRAAFTDVLVGRDQGFDAGHWSIKREAEEYAALQREWVALIRARQLKGETSDD